MSWSTIDQTRLWSETRAMRDPSLNRAGTKSPTVQSRGSRRSRRPRATDPHVTALTQFVQAGGFISLTAGSDKTLACAWRALGLHAAFFRGGMGHWILQAPAAL